MAFWVALATVVQGIASIVAIAISVATLKQTNKIQQDATKPYIVAFLEKHKISNSDVIFLVIKNFGQTGATIKSVKTNPRLTNPALKTINIPIDNMCNQFIAPGQSFTSGISISPSIAKLKEDFFKIEIKYLDNQQKMQISTFNLNVKAIDKLDHFITFPTNADGIEKALYTLGSEYFITRL